MIKDDFFKNRIVSYSKRHYLFENNCVVFDDASEEKKDYLESILPNRITTILLFWDDKENWTVVATNSVFSFYEGSLKHIRFEDLVEPNSNEKTFQPCLEKKYELSKEEKYKIKTESKWLYAFKPKVYLRLPSSREVTGLYNLLLMVSRLKYKGSEER